MNLSPLIPIAVLVCAAPSHAAGTHAQLPGIEVRPGAPVIVACKDAHRPSLRDMAQLVSSNNAAYVFAQREHLMQFAERACLHGASSVTFVPDGGARSPSFAMLPAHR
ncbi:MAG TPA: hypothetical protein VJR95_11645 [Rhodanobacter sp.]|nr:hypothetical protein [Rhodanobacter sp.]